MTEDWRIVTEQPAILADILDVFMPLARLRYASQRPLGRRRFVLLRWAEVIRRFAPDDALAVLDEELPDVVETPMVPHLTEPAVRAATLLEKGEHQAAAELLPRVSQACGARDLLEGRVAMQEARFDDAWAHYERAEVAARVAGTPLSVEIEVEALGSLARLFAMRGMDATAWFRRLAARCAELDLGLTRMAFERLERASRPEARARSAAQATVALKSHLVHKYAEPYQADIPKLGPVPLHVHGMAKTHATEPNAFVNAIGTMASIQWREGDRQRAFETAWYGRAIGRRLFGAEVEASLTEFIDLLLGPLPPERRQAFETRLRINALGKAEA